jgi:type IV pilus assembly protein PilV
MTLSHAAQELVRAPRSQCGFTMLEVLVALLILLIGLLGLAGLLVTTQQGEVEAYQRKQATVLLQDMVDRVTANPIAATCYAITTNATDGAPALGTGYGGSFVCAAGSASQQARGGADLQAWNNALLGTSEKKGSVNVGTVIEARGCVTNPSTGVYAVSVAWRGLASTVAPPAAYTCGKNLYLDAGGVADDRLRRVISITIRIANLTS